MSHLSRLPTAAVWGSNAAFAETYLLMLILPSAMEVWQEYDVLLVVKGQPMHAMHA
jgi:hypothetical protein